MGSTLVIPLPTTYSTQCPESLALESTPWSQILHTITPVPEQIRRFPQTRYYGSKRRLLNWIYSTVKSLEFETVIDVFGGTASVSQLFLAMSKAVTYHDAFRFNSDVAATLLSNQIAITRKDLDEFLSSIDLSQGTICRNFKGIFYTDEENAWLDGFMAHLSQSNLPKKKAQLLRYLLYQACLKKRPFNLFHRANLKLRTNTEVKRSFGNFSTWEKPFRSHMMQAYEEVASSRTSISKNVNILQPCDALNIPGGTFDLVYLDPPYVHSQDSYNRDDYWRKYHFLEGLANYDNWESRIDVKSNIRLMPAPNRFANWSRQDNFKESLFSLIRTHSTSIVVLSYVTKAYPSDLEIKEFFESIFPKVQIHSIEHAHALSSTKKRELLYIGFPK